jgi:hypothetical protein
LAAFNLIEAQELFSNSMPSYAFFYFCDQANSSDFLEQITENNDDIKALLFAVIAGSSFPCLKILIQVDNLI